MYTNDPCVAMEAIHRLVPILFPDVAEQILERMTYPELVREGEFEFHVERHPNVYRRVPSSVARFVAIDTYTLDLYDGPISRDADLDPAPPICDPARQVTDLDVRRWHDFVRKDVLEDASLYAAEAMHAAPDEETREFMQHQRDTFARDDAARQRTRPARERTQQALGRLQRIGGAR